MGRLDKAAAAYQQAIDIDPSNAEFQFNLGNLLAQAQDIDGAIILFERTIELDPSHFRALKYLGGILASCGDYKKATNYLQIAVDLEPNNIETQLELAGVAARNGMAAKAIDIYKNNFDIKLPSLGILGELAFAHLVNRHPRLALKAAEDSLSILPGWTKGIAFKAIALNELEFYAEAQEILGLDRFLQCTEIEPPHNYTNLEAFNLALIRHIKKHPTLRYNSTNRSLSNARCTEELLGRGQGPFEDFERLISAALKRYLKTITGQQDHPFLISQPGKLSFDVWANIMDEKGYQDVHFHPTSWATGVYYPSADGIIDADGEDNNEKGFGGWLELGATYFMVPSVSKPKLHYIKPRPGLLVLFPSYIGHRTIPCQGQGERISIAFDIRPEG